MSLVTLAEVRALVSTSLVDVDLQDVIDREEAEMIRLFGPHYDGNPIEEQVYDEGQSTLFLKRRITSVASVTEYSVLTASGVGGVLTTDQYGVDARIGAIHRIGANWGPRVAVSYVPEDDTALRKSVLIDLVRLAVSQQTALQSESMRADNLSYSYSAPSGGWDKARISIYRRLGGWSV